jgi:hypothetical protein
MESFNKVISFILGLVVVIVFFAVISGKLNLSKIKTSISKGTKPTPKLSPSPTPISTVKIPSVTTTNNYGSYNAAGKTTGASQIPSTGLPVFFIPSLLAGVLGGNLLRKNSSGSQKSPH